MLTFKRIKKLIIFLGLIAVINFILGFVLQPSLGTTPSEIMWRDLKKEKVIDTVFIGSSVCQRTFDPYLLDNDLDIKSFNMGTPAQSLQETYVGLKEIIRNQKLKRVILGIGHFSLVQEKNVGSEIKFINSKEKTFRKRIIENIKYSFSKEHIKNIESINFLFPWIYNNCGFNPKNIIKNLKIKLNIIQEEKVEIEGYPVYIGKGFGISEITHDYNKVGDKISGKIYPKEVFSYNFEALKKIIRLCKENGVDIIVINSPHTIYDILSYGDEYFLTMEDLKNLFKNLEVSYYDFNLIKPNIFENREDYFYDHEHLNRKGSTEFSKSFAKFMKLREKGEDMEKYFYTPEEYLESIKHISIVNFDTENREKGINILAKAYTGSKVNVEYEMLAYNESLNKYEIIREYDKNPEYFYLVNENKKYKIRVNARQVGTNVPYEKYYEKEIEFRR